MSPGFKDRSLFMANRGGEVESKVGGGVENINSVCQVGRKNIRRERSFDSAHLLVINNDRSLTKNDVKQDTRRKCCLTNLIF